MTLRLIPEILDPVDVVLPLSEEFRVVDPIVLKLRNIQRVITPPTVRINDAIGHDFALDNRRQSRARSVGDNLGINLPTPF